MQWFIKAYSLFRFEQPRGWGVWVTAWITADIALDISQVEWQFSQYNQGFESTAAVSSAFSSKANYTVTIEPPLYALKL